MKISLRKKIILTFLAFTLVSGAVWSLGYYQYYILNQKLQIIERKDNLLNTILEARRYEKNFFITLDSTHLSEAISFVREGEDKLARIIENYGRFTLAKNLGQNLDELRRYGVALKSLSDFYRENPRGGVDSPARFSKYSREIRDLGRKITVDMENVLLQERKYAKEIIRESEIYFFMALGSIFVLSFFTTLFLIFNVNRPLKTIEVATHKIAEGDYDNIPEISSGDEFRSLVSSLNTMIAELKKRNEQLVQTEKMASLGTLTSGVAHELNNPLNNISTSVQILLEELEDGNPDYKRGLLTDAEKQVERARDIVRALLEFSRERSFDLKEIRFKDLVDNTVKLIKGELPSNVELQVEVPPEIRGTMDPARIQQVLINLLMNGVQAMENGGVLSIRAGKNMKWAGFCFEVKDTGKGIPSENLAKIFDPFFTTKHVGSGAGLGLSVSHGIIEKHGGRIEVDSKQDQGTTFRVYLPDHDIK